MSIRSITLLALAAGTVSSLAAEDGPTTNAELLKRIEELDQRIRILDRKAEIAGEEVAAKAKTASVAKAGDDGFSIGTADGSYQLKLGVLVQADGRFWLNDGDSKQAKTEQVNTFLIRRAIPTFDAKLGKYVTARLQTNFATAGTLLEAWGNIKAADALWFRVGRYKTLGVEYYANTAGLIFSERGLPTNLVPQYDLGATAGGAVGKLASWSLGVVNGAADGGTRDTDVDDDKDAYGIVAVTPFAADADSPLAGLKLTFGASVGYETGAVGASSLTAGYKTPGQVTVFTYSANSYALGDRSRYAPAIEYYGGPVAFVGEYTVSNQNIHNGLRKEEVSNTAWQGTLSYVLTGEKRTASGVAPRQAFDPEAGTWGAFEVALRFGELSVDDAAFAGDAERFSNPTTSVKKATNFGLGVNWWLTKNLKLQTSYDHTSFEGGGGGTVDEPKDRESEQVVVSRLQVNF